MTQTPPSVPVTLPAHWDFESAWCGVILNASNAAGCLLGSVTVCEKTRGYVLGMSRVRVSAEEAQYAGSGWREHLYSDAVEALQTALELSAQTGTRASSPRLDDLCCRNPEDSIR